MSRLPCAPGVPATAADTVTRPVTTPATTVATNRPAASVTPVTTGSAAPPGCATIDTVTAAPGTGTPQPSSTVNTTAPDWRGSTRGIAANAVTDTGTPAIPTTFETATAAE